MDNRQLLGMLEGQLTVGGEVRPLSSLEMVPAVPKAPDPEVPWNPDGEVAWPKESVDPADFRARVTTPVHGLGLHPILFDCAGREGRYARPWRDGFDVWASNGHMIARQPTKGMDASQVGFLPTWDRNPLDMGQVVQRLGPFDERSPLALPDVDLKRPDCRSCLGAGFTEMLGRCRECKGYGSAEVSGQRVNLWADLVVDRWHAAVLKRYGCLVHPPTADVIARRGGVPPAFRFKVGPVVGFLIPSWRN